MTIMTYSRRRRPAGGCARVSFSVVINTDDRLAHLDRPSPACATSTYLDFEVCVVVGPTPDGTRGVPCCARGRD